MTWEEAKEVMEALASNPFHPQQPVFIAALQRVEELEREKDEWRSCAHAAEAHQCEGAIKARDAAEAEVRRLEGLIVKADSEEDEYGSDMIALWDEARRIREREGR